MKEQTGKKEYWKDKTYFSMDAFYSDEQTQELIELLKIVKNKAKQYANDNAKKKSIKGLRFRRMKFYDMTFALLLIVCASFGMRSEAFAGGNDPHMRMSLFAAKSGGNDPTAMMATLGHADEFQEFYDSAPKPTPLPGGGGHDPTDPTHQSDCGGGGHDPSCRENMETCVVIIDGYVLEIRDRYFCRKQKLIKGLQSCASSKLCLDIRRQLFFLSREESM